MLRRSILLFFLYCWGSVQAAQMLVIHSDVPDRYPQGQYYADDTVIHLPANKQATFLFATGGYRTIIGDYHQTITDPRHNYPADESLLSTLSEALLSGRLNDVVTRSTPAAPDNVWLVNLETKRRHYCISTKSGVKLWRAKDKNQTAGSLTIKHKLSGKRTQTMWPAHQSIVTWPNALPIHYGDTYTVELNNLRGNSTFKKLVLYELPKRLPTNSHKVVWMIGRGCIPQANMLLATLR